MLKYKKENKIKIVLGRKSLVVGMYRFEKLRVYQNAIKLVKLVYEVSSKLPKEETFSLIAQLKRACISIVLNIAEGTGGLGDKEFKSFLRIALKSLYETVAGLKVSNSLFNINIDYALAQCEIVGKELHALIKSLTRDQRPKTND